MLMVLPEKPAVAGVICIREGLEATKCSAGEAVSSLGISNTKLVELGCCDITTARTKTGCKHVDDVMGREQCPC
jgi:hypothetical protein